MNCLYCGVLISGLQKKYCSKSHNKMAWKKRNWRKVLDDNNILAKKKARENWVRKNCLNCGKNFLPDIKHKYAVYCSVKCREKFNNRKQKQIKKEANAKRIFICTVCKKEYKPSRSFQKTCGDRRCVLNLWHKKKQQDPEFRKKRALWQRNRKHKIRANGGNLTIAEWEEIKKKQDYTCNDCLRREPEIKLTMDHIIAIKNKGKHEASNIQGLCQSCNSTKD